jgi:hypothetical protein
MRAALAIIAGFIAAFAVQSGVDVISNQFYPAAITDVWNRQQVSEAMAARPTGALLLTVLGYFLGGLAGGTVAKLIHRRSWACWAPVGLFACTALLLILAYPLAEWAGFGSFLAALIGGLIANHLIASRSPEAEAAEPEPQADASV